MATEIWVNIGSGNGLLPDGTKPLPEPMLTDHQWSPVTFILRQFHKRCLNHQSLKFVWTNSRVGSNLNSPHKGPVIWKVFLCYGSSYHHGKSGTIEEKEKFDLTKGALSDKWNTTSGESGMMVDPEYYLRYHSGYGLSQWEEALHSNTSSHWLSPYPE